MAQKQTIKNEKKQGSKPVPKIQADKVQRRPENTRPSAVSNLLQQVQHTPESLTPADKVQLQRTLGNQALRVLGTGSNTAVIQTKLTLGPANDQYEQEADNVAQQVVSQINSPEATQRQEEDELQTKRIDTVQRQEEEEMAMAKRADTVQRQEEEELQAKPVDTVQRQEEEEMAMAKRADTIQRQEEEELQAKPVDAIQRQEEEEMAMAKRADTVQRQEEEELQAKPVDAVQRQEEEEMAMAKSASSAEGGPISADIESTIQGVRGSGQPIADNMRQPMEQAFQADFTGVRVHTDSQADGLNQSLQARAFTTGQDIFFRQGEYNPTSQQGQGLLAHELTHVVQQSGGQLQRDWDPAQADTRSLAPEARLPSIQRVVESGLALGQAPEINQRTQSGRVHRHFDSSEAEKTVKQQFADLTTTGFGPFKKRMDEPVVKTIDGLLDQYEVAVKANKKDDQFRLLTAVWQQADGAIPEENKVLFGDTSDSDLVTALKATKRIVAGLKAPLQEPEEAPVGEAFLERYPRAKRLVHGIDLHASENEQLQALLDNMLRENFEYSMRHANWQDYLSERAADGDCKTLSETFLHIAQDYFGIDSVEVDFEEKTFFVQGGGAVKDKNGSKGNVDGGKHWLFTSHYWVKTPLGEIDLLFRNQRLNKSGWDYLSTIETVKPDCEKHTFGKFSQAVYDYIKEGPLATRYTTNTKLVLT